MLVGLRSLMPLRGPFSAMPSLALLSGLHLEPDVTNVVILWRNLGIWDLIIH